MDIQPPPRGRNAHSEFKRGIFRPQRLGGMGNKARQGRGIGREQRPGPPGLAQRLPLRAHLLRGREADLYRQHGPDQGREHRYVPDHWGTQVRSTLLILSGSRCGHTLRRLPWMLIQIAVCRLAREVPNRLNRARAASEPNRPIDPA